MKDIDILKKWLDNSIAKEIVKSNAQYGYLLEFARYYHEQKHQAELKKLRVADVSNSADYKTFYFSLDNRKADQLRSTLNEYKSIEYTTIVQFKRNGGMTHIGIQYHEMFVIELVWLGIHTGITLKTLKAQQ